MKVSFNLKNIAKINQDTLQSLIKTAEAIKTDLIQSQTVPFDVGTMQNDSMYVDDKRATKGNVKIVTDTPYARKIYFDPEINIKQGENPNAKQYYFEDYITGGKKGLPIRYFKTFMKGKV